MRRISRAIGPALVLLIALPAVAQPPGGSGQLAAGEDRRLAEAVPAPESATFVYANRPITVLRARLATLLPTDRVRSATRLLDRLIDQGVSGPVSSVVGSGVALIRVGDRDVLVLVLADLDQVIGETLAEKSAETEANLRLALGEAAELRTPSRLLSAATRVLGAAVLLVVIVALLWRAYRRMHALALEATERRLARVLSDQVEVGRGQTPVLANVTRLVVRLAVLTLTALLAYWWATFSLRQFPYTRPWGESLRTRLLDLVGRIALGIVHALPNLFLVAVILGITRILVQASDAFFRNVERGTVHASWAYPETAGATRHLVAIMLWLFGLVVSYPYLPGSGSDAFKGVSVFVGLVISLGSSGVVNQLMSGLTLIYSRALKAGDIVKIGENEGRVTSINLLSVKIRTVDKEVTVPNAVVVGQSTVNYSQLAPDGGSFLATVVTIGYDTPWRQVRSLLMLAAERTPNVRRDPPARVVQDALEDFYVRYRLVVCLEQAANWPITRDLLHANIQDAFNEFGVQIMSPNYVMDPASPKLVPASLWNVPPAAPPSADVHGSPSGLEPQPGGTAKSPAVAQSDVPAGAADV